MSAAFNDYVLTTSLEQGWVTNEQAEQVKTVLTANPAVAALDLMEEQQLLSSDHAKTLRELIAQAGGQEEKDPSVLRAYLEAAIQMGASDLHLGPDAPALVRMHGQLVPLEGSGARFLAKAETEQLARSFLTPKQSARVEEHGSVDFCYDAAGLCRFRTSVVRQRRGWESVFRAISSQIRTMDELALPPVLKTLTRYHNGLVLVTGPVGSGKSTTLAAMWTTSTRSGKTISSRWRIRLSTCSRRRGVRFPSVRSAATRKVFPVRSGPPSVRIPM